MKNTDTKEKILGLLFNFPLRTFHIREISRILNISAPSISKAVKKLEKESMIISKKGVVYEIKANIDNLDFKQSKRAHNLKSVYDSGLFNYLYENFQLDNIILFGSYSKGEDTEKSDVDIAIESKEKNLELSKYEEKINRRINIEFIDFSKLKKELKESIINGIILSGYITLK